MVWERDSGSGRAVELTAYAGTLRALEGQVRLEYADERISAEYRIKRTWIMLFGTK